jgi:hypothetical protein
MSQNAISTVRKIRTVQMDSQTNHLKCANYATLRNANVRNIIHLENVKVI